MKIDEVLVSGYYRGGKSAKASGKGGGSFSEVLAQKVGQQDKPVPASAPQALDLGQPEVAPSPLFKGVDDMLQALERYSQALGDPNQTLKDIEPLADDLEAQASRLEELLGKNQSGPLDELAAQATTQARVELMKFRRGDYV